MSTWFTENLPAVCYALQKHKDSGADVTVSCVPMDDSRASDYGLMKIDGKGRINSFNEKPKGDDLQCMVRACSVALLQEYLFRILLRILVWC